MSKNLKLFKKITCILGITFLVLGMVPLPVISKITTAAASVNEGSDSVSPKKLGLPKLHFTINGNNNNGECGTGCQGENAECGISADGKACCPGLDCVLFNPTSGNYKCKISACTPSGSCPTTCGYDGTDISDGCGGTIACDPTPACCTPSGTCPTTCGYDGTDISDGCGGTIACDPTPACCTPSGICPTTCGYDGTDIPDGCGGTIACDPTAACPPIDNCPLDPAKTEPGVCGCGTPDVDSDGDGVLDCIDNCPSDGAKVDPGACGCGVADTDSDGDGTPDCLDGCVDDAFKTDPGACGCGFADADTDGDGTLDCNDGCVNDATKTAPGTCGCGVADADTDGDGTLDCNDGCVNDPAKTAQGLCGCGVADTDSDSDGIPDCDLPCLGEWGECVGECGVDGIQTFTVLQAADPGGAACEFEDGEERACPGDPCPVDCIWSDWSACSAACGGGTQTRSIAVQAANGGLECEGPTSQACNTQGCPPPPPPPAGGPIIPVTGGAGGPVDPLIIPVTGIDLSINLAGLQKLFMFMGLMLFGVTMMLEGFDRKRIK
jgi:hypothetical protein